MTVPVEPPGPAPCRTGVTFDGVLCVGDVAEPDTGLVDGAGFVGGAEARCLLTVGFRTKKIVAVGALVIDGAFVGLRGQFFVNSDLVGERVGTGALVVGKKVGGGGGRRTGRLVGAGIGWPAEVPVGLTLLAGCGLRLGLLVGDADDDEVVEEVPVGVVGAGLRTLRGRLVAGVVFDEP